MRLKIYTDGSIRPKTHGIISIGAIFVVDGLVVHELSINLGLSGTSQLAELLAILRALEEAKLMVSTQSKTVVDVFSDNLGNVKVLRGKKKRPFLDSKENLGKYVTAIRNIEREFKAVRYHWQSAEYNMLADQLSHRGHDLPALNNGTEYRDKFNEFYTYKGKDPEIQIVDPIVFIEHPSLKGHYLKVNIQTKTCSCPECQDRPCIHVIKAKQLYRAKKKKQH